MIPATGHLCILQEGDFHMAFDTTLGLPWDPHSSAAYWCNWKAYLNAFANLANASSTEGFQLQHPMSQAQLHDMIAEVLVAASEPERQRLWATILQAVHEQSILAPLSHLVNVAVVRDRFENFVFGQQQYDMQLHRLLDRQLLGSAAAGAGTARISGAAMAGIVASVVVALLAMVCVAVLVLRERRGKPVFGPYEPFLAQEGDAKVQMSGAPAAAAADATAVAAAGRTVALMRV
jgi:hypothetical protein